MSNFIEQLDKGAEAILKILKRFPTVSFLAYLFALIMIVFMSIGHGEMKSYPNYNFFNRLAFTLTLAIPFLIFLQLLLSSRLLSFLGLGVMAYYFTTLPESLEKAQGFEEYGQLHLFLMGISFLLIFPAPYLFKKVSNKQFWQWTKEILFALLTALFFSAILYAGLYGISYALKTLFMVQFTRDLIPQIILGIFGLFTMNYFLSQIPEEPLTLTLKPYNKIENILSKYILTPLFVIYFIVLFAYTFKIIFLGETPKGSISILVLFFAHLGILTALFLTGVWNGKNKKYKKIIWIAIILQTLVLAVSVYFRIEQYGLTENRYFILLLGMWLLLISFYFLFNKNSSYKWIFISLALLMLLIQYKPLSGKILAKESQISQLKEILGEHETLSNSSDIDVRYNISNKIEYLYRKYKEDALMPVLPQIVSEFKLLKNSSQIDNCNVAPPAYFVNYATEKLGFRVVSQWEWKQSKEKKVENDMPIYITNHNSYGEKTLNIAGYEWLQSFSYTISRKGELFCPPQPFEVREESSTITPFKIKTKQNNIIINKDGKDLAKIEITAFIEGIKEIWRNRNKNTSMLPYRREQLEDKQLLHLYENKSIKIKLLFRSIELSEKEELRHYGGELLIHQK